MNATRIYLFLLALFLCLAPLTRAQSNAHADYKHQHKAAQKYQKSILKQQRKQQKDDAKRARKYRAQHQ